MNIPALAALLENWRIGRDKELLVVNDTLYWRLTVDGRPTTVPQTCAELVNAPVDGPVIVAAVNNLPALLRIAQAAVAWRECCRSDADLNGACGRHDRHLIAAIDSALSTGEAGK